jgi:hypothetical protein
VVRCHYSVSATDSQLLVKRGYRNVIDVLHHLIHTTAQHALFYLRSDLFHVLCCIVWIVATTYSHPSSRLEGTRDRGGWVSSGPAWPGVRLVAVRLIVLFSMRSSHLHFSHAPIYRPDLEEQAYSRPFGVVGVYHTTTNPALRICSWWEHRDIEVKSTGDRFLIVAH